MIDWKGEVKRSLSSPPDVIRSYFDNIFNSDKVKQNPYLNECLAEIETYTVSNVLTDKDIDMDDLNNAITNIGKGVSYDGIPGKILQFLPANFRDCILYLIRTIFFNYYPTQWRNQLLFPIEKKGHSNDNPKLRGIAVGPLMSRVFDIIINNRFLSWYYPNPQQAGNRKKQGCSIQIFALFLSVEMASILGKPLYIGLLDFEKAFDFLNRKTLLKDLMNKGIGNSFLKNLCKTYDEIIYLPKVESNMMGDGIISNHGVTQGRNSSGSLFSFYISDMSDCLNGLHLDDFTDPENLLQLADDSVILAEHEHTLASKFEKVYEYVKNKYIVVNNDKTRYLHFSDNPTLQDILFDNGSVQPVDPIKGYDWLGFHLLYSSKVSKLIEKNFNKKKVNIGKFYAWLQVNNNTPFSMKMKVLYGCLFPALLYSCETWGNINFLQKELDLIERKALKSCLGVKQGTSNEVVYIETNKAGIVNSVYARQYNFFAKFIRLDHTESSAKSIWDKYKALENINKPILNHYENLEKPSSSLVINERKSIINNSEKQMLIRYRNLFNLEYNDVLYESMIDDSYRSIITRWRLSSHQLFIETGRYQIPYINRPDRLCKICDIVEDETHSLFYCRAHTLIRNQYRDILQRYTTVSEILNPKDVIDIIQIAKYIKEIEKNMDKMKMIR